MLEPRGAGNEIHYLQTFPIIFILYIYPAVSDLFQDLLQPLSYVYIEEFSSTAFNNMRTVLAFSWFPPSASPPFSPLPMYIVHCTYIQIVSYLVLATALGP